MGTYPPPLWFRESSLNTTPNGLVQREQWDGGIGLQILRVLLTLQGDPGSQLGDEQWVAAGGAEGRSRTLYATQGAIFPAEVESIKWTRYRQFHIAASLRRSESQTKPGIVLGL